MFSQKGTTANPAFVKWAEDYVLLLHVTSYVFTDPHHDLYAERGGFGHPYVAILDAEGQWLAGEHGVLTLDECGALARSAEELQELSAVEAFAARLRNEALSYDEAVARREELANEIAEEQRAEIAQLIINREIAAELARMRRQYPKHRELSRAMAPKAAALFRAGKVPTNRLASHYMRALFGYAQATKDRELYAEAVEKLEELYADNGRYRAMVQSYKKQLEAWK